MMEMMVTAEAIRHAKLQSNCHHQQTNIQFFLSFMRPNQQWQSTEGKISHPIDLLTQTHLGVFQLCL